MQRKQRYKKITILVIFFVLAILLVGALLGRNSTVDYVSVQKEGIDVNKPLNQQLEFFTTKRMLKEELEEFNGSIVTDLKQLEEQKLLYPLSVGAPVTFDALTKEGSGGQFAKTMPENYTIFKLIDAVSSLPPGVQAGDKLNIGLTLEGADEKGGLMTGVVLHEAEVYSVEETSVYIIVSAKNHIMMSTAQKIGNFVYQLPGQKNIGECAEGEQSNGFCGAEKDRPSVITKQEIIDRVMNSDSYYESQEAEEEKEGDVLDKVTEEFKKDFEEKMSSEDVDSKKEDGKDSDSIEGGGSNE